MFRQKLSAIGMLVVGFLAGCAANLVARDLTAAKIGVVGDLVEWPRDSDGRPLPRSTMPPFPLTPDQNGEVERLRPGDPPGVRRILVLYPAPPGRGGGLADPGHDPPPEHCAFYFAAYYFEYHC